MYIGIASEENLPVQVNLFRVVYNPTRVCRASGYLSPQLQYRATDADWGRDMRGKILIAPIALRNYVVISTRRDGRVAEPKVGPAEFLPDIRAPELMVLFVR